MDGLSLHALLMKHESRWTRMTSKWSALVGNVVINRSAKVEREKMVYLQGRHKARLRRA